MGIFDSMKSNGKSSSDEMRPSPVREFLGQELFAIDCRGSNLYVHENAVVIDKTGAGFGMLATTTSKSSRSNPSSPSKRN